MASARKTWLAALLIVLGAIAVLLLATVFLSRGPHSFNERLEVPLPLAIGGILGVSAEGEFTFDVFNLAANTDMRLSLSPEDLNNSLPIESYSILVQEVENEKISSMLGRLEFVPGSAKASIEGNDLSVSADLTGIMFVRENRRYKADEEQPDSGLQLDLNAQALLTAKNLTITPQWGLGEAELIADIRLDEQTRADWKGLIGEGDELALLIETVLNQRANSQLGRIDAASIDFRKPITKLLGQISKRIKAEKPEFAFNPVNLVRFQRIEIDNCPSQSDTGSIGISFGVATELIIDEPSQDLPALPDLSVRDTPCSSAAFAVEAAKN